MHAKNDIAQDVNKNHKTASPIRRTDRRPKGVSPMRRRSICITAKLDQLVMGETMRRGYPSVSAYIEDAIFKEVTPKGEAAEEVELLREIRQIATRLHRLERESAERDTIAVELVAGLARTYFATVEPPAPDVRQARVAEAKTQFERFLNAVGRKLESGDTTLQMLPDVNLAPESAGGQDAVEENFRPDAGGEGAHNAGV